MSAATEIDELVGFDEGFTPQASNFNAGIDSLADGEYDFTILNGMLDRTPKNNELLLRWELRVESTGRLVEHVYFFRDQEAVNRLGGDLGTLGFDVGNWKLPDRPFARELPNAVKQLAGRRFKATKKSKPEKVPQGWPATGKIYHNLYINAALPPKNGSNGNGHQNGSTLTPAQQAVHSQAAAATAKTPRDEVPF